MAETVIMLCYVTECRDRCSGRDSDHAVLSLNVETNVVAETVIMLCYVIECRERCSGRDSDHAVLHH